MDGDEREDKGHTQSTHRVAMAISILAYISSRWKNQPSLVKVGGARTPPVTLSAITSKVLVYVPAERADTLPLFLFYPYIYSVIRVSA